MENIRFNVNLIKRTQAIKPVKILSLLIRFVSFMAEARSFPQPSAAQIQTFLGS